MRASDILLNYFQFFPNKLLEKMMSSTASESTELQIIKIQLRIEFCCQIE